MYDYGSPEKNKEHYGTVSVNINIHVQQLWALILTLATPTSNMYIFQYIFHIFSIYFVKQSRALTLVGDHF